MACPKTSQKWPARNFGWIWKTARRHQTSNKQEADKYTHGQWSSKNTNRLIDTGARRHSADMKSVCLVDLQKAAKWLWHSSINNARLYNWLRTCRLLIRLVIMRARFCKELHQDRHSPFKEDIQHGHVWGKLHFNSSTETLAYCALQCYNDSSKHNTDWLDLTKLLWFDLPYYITFKTLYLSSDVSKHTKPPVNIYSNHRFSRERKTAVLPGYG